MKRIFISFSAFAGFISAITATATAAAQCPVPPACDAPSGYCAPTCGAPDGCSNYSSPSCAVPGGCNSCGPSGYTAQASKSCDHQNDGRPSRLFGGIKLLNFTKISVDNKEKCCRGGSDPGSSPASSPASSPTYQPAFTYAPVPITMMAYQPVMMQPAYAMPAMAPAAAPAFAAPRPAASDDCGDVCKRLSELESSLRSLRASVEKMESQEDRLTALETAVKNIDEANRKQTDILEKLGSAVERFSVPPVPNTGG